MLITDMLPIAQVGVGGDFGKAVAITMAIIYGWILLLGLSLLLFIWGLATIKRRAGKARAVIGGLMILSLSYAAYTVAQSSRKERLSVHYDFRESRTPPAGKWSNFADLGWLSHDGIVSAHIELPFGLEFRGVANLVTVSRRGDAVESVKIQRFNLSKEQARAFARTYSNWSGRHGPTQSEFEQPALLGHVETRRTDDNSWSVSLSASWERPETTGQQR